MGERVKIYGSDTCTNCSMAKSYFEERGIEYDFVDVTKNKEALSEMREVSGGARSIPVIVACGKVIIGFDQAMLGEGLECLK
ncbi:MAG TPA: glutaredoxin family protein [Deltaproteobacteria bacterium]|nr:glutaredoxin family protein [Deltaproteobacteria bacterium]